VPDDIEELVKAIKAMMLGSGDELVLIYKGEE